MPFLDNVLRGRPVPEARKLAVAEHYYHFGGKSPINDCNRQLVNALTELADLPVYFGNRNWNPFLTDTLAQMADRGVQRALAFLTSALSSYSGCRQYQEDIEAARARLGSRAPEVFVLRRYFNHPRFVRAASEHLREAIAELGVAKAETHVVFSAHSIPESMSARCDYQAQFEEVAALVAREAGVSAFSLAYQSRSGAPSQPWLEPDILDELGRLSRAGVAHVAICPVGFVSDHMEVVWDLDIEAKQRASELGLSLARAKTAGAHPEFAAMVQELVEEQTQGKVPRAVGRYGPRVAPCRPGCCPPPERRGKAR
jgi:ferrochelatase